MNKEIEYSYTENDDGSSVITVGESYRAEFVKYHKPYYYRRYSKCKLIYIDTLEKHRNVHWHYVIKILRSFRRDYEE